MMVEWLSAADLATVRHPFFLAALPTEEIEAWTDFWDEVRELRDLTES